jgi:hypothetical protein
LKNPLATTAEDVFQIEDEDRRNVIFKTMPEDTDPDRHLRNLATYIRKDLLEDLAWAQGFAWLLERVQIDWKLLSRSYQTRGYAAVKVQQMEASNPLYLWAQSNFEDYRKLKNRVSARDLRQRFSEDNPKVTLTQSKFNKKLKELIGLPGVPAFVLVKPNNILSADFGVQNGSEDGGRSAEGTQTKTLTGNVKTLTGNQNANREDWDFDEEPSSSGGIWDLDE